MQYQTGEITIKKRILSISFRALANLVLMALILFSLQALLIY